MNQQDSRRKWIKIFGVIAISFLLIFSIWYDLTYSMSTAKSFEVNDPQLDTKLLIATQGSAYKDAVVAEVVSHFRKHPIYIKVIDVYELPNTALPPWDAIALIHTWEIWRAPAPVRHFFQQSPDLSKLAVHVTSGDGHYKMEGVDAITGASVPALATKKAALLTKRIEQILSRQSAADQLSRAAEFNQ